MTLAAILGAADAGLSYRAIADATGYSYQRVGQLVQAARAAATISPSDSHGTSH